MTGQASKHKSGLSNNKTLNEMSNTELQELLAKLREQNMAYKGAIHSASPKAMPNMGIMRQTRITIARILTIMRKRGGAR